jgi:hypothetical protein
LDGDIETAEAEVMRKMKASDLKLTVFHWGADDTPYSMEIATPREALNVYFTPTGLIRVGGPPRRLKARKTKSPC